MDGATEGTADGAALGFAVGPTDGVTVGTVDGTSDGATLTAEGIIVGTRVRVDSHPHSATAVHRLSFH